MNQKCYLCIDCAQRTLNSQPSTLNHIGRCFLQRPRTRSEQGDEIPVWTVYVGDDEDELIGTVYRGYSFTKAEGFAKRMSADRRLELIREALGVTAAATFPTIVNVSEKPTDLRLKLARTKKDTKTDTNRVVLSSVGVVPDYA